MKVTLIAQTTFTPPLHVPWYPNDDVDMSPDLSADDPKWGGSSLVEFAGRACYQSWGRPNPATASNADYLRHILNVGHFSVLEHASATFYVEGVSRSLTHELVRHRHLSFSQLSQRFVNEENVEYVVPPVLRADINDGSSLDDAQVLDEAMQFARSRYLDLVDLLTQQYGLKRKQAREAARCVLPNMTETKIVVTGNFRAWRHFIDLRATAQADVEIRELALTVLSKLNGIAPNVFGDYVVAVVDGVHVAASTATGRDG